MPAGSGAACGCGAAHAEDGHLAAEGASPPLRILDRSVGVLHGAHQLDHLAILDCFVLVNRHGHRIARPCGVFATPYTAGMPGRSKPGSRKPRNSKARAEHPSVQPYRQKERGERLQKVLADAGVASRRECEALIIEGAVTVNGKTIDTLPAWADPALDRIEVYGRPLRPAEKHVYVMLFKPRGTVCTNSDPEGRPRAIDLVKHPTRARLYCVGRLDLDASGLLVLTNDGEFANRLTHPRYQVPKGYDLTLDGKLDATAIAAIRKKIFADPARASAEDEPRSSIRLISTDSEKSIVHLELCEHRNLQIKDLMLGLGHPVKKMRRTSFGPLKLKGLAVGEWRDLTSREIDMLTRASRGSKGAAKGASKGRPSERGSKA